MAITIPEGQRLFDVVNESLHTMLDKMTRLQVYLDDWATLTNAQKNGIKNRVSSEIDARISMLNDLKTYINGQ